MAELRGEVALFMVGAVAFLSGCSGEQGGRQASGVEGPEAGTRAVLDFTSVPPLNSTANLVGVARHVNPASYRVAVYIRVAGQWWTKPTAASPYTPIKANGSWTCDITTGGQDPTADKIAAFLASQAYAPPVLLGAGALPAALYQNSAAWVEYTRMVGANFRTLTFSGYEWAAKTSTEKVGPGPNLFSDSGENVWLDKTGKLHLKITHDSNGWHCAEVLLRGYLGYGSYLFTLGSYVDALDPRVVLGLFTWDDRPAQAHRELDIEFSRWGDPAADNAQDVVQPYTQAGNVHRFLMTHVAPSTHLFGWQPGQVSFRSGWGSTPSGRLIDKWLYTGPDVPTPGQENARMNLWLFKGRAPSNRQEVEVVVSRFRHTP